MALEAFKRHSAAFINEMRHAYQDAKKYLEKEDKVILGLAVGAISVFTLGILTKPAYTYLVGRLKKDSKTFKSHQLAVTDKINQKVFNNDSNNKDVLIKDDKITITKAQYTDKELQQLLVGNPSITSLTLLGCTNITDEALKNLPKSLTSLSLIGCDRITDEGIQNLESLSELTTLELAGCDSITDESLKTIGKLEKLKHLDLAGCLNLTNKGMENLKSLELESLDISDCKKIDDDGVRNFSETTRKSIKSLNLKRTAVSETNWSVSFQNLENLYLEGSFTTISLNSAPMLKNLEISNSSTTSAELKIWLPESLTGLKIIKSKEILNEIGNTSLQNIEVLDLSNNTEIPDEFLEKIDKNKLKELSLREVPENEVIKCIKDCNSLEKLDLSGVKMNELDLSSLSKLKEVDLRDTGLKENNVFFANSKPENVHFETKKPLPPQPEITEEVKFRPPKTEIINKKTNPEVPVEQKKEVILPKNLKGFDPKTTTDIKLPINATDEDLKALVLFENLTSLDLTGCNEITEQGIKNLNQLENLRKLNLTGCNLSDDAWDEVGEMRELTSLTLDNSNISQDNFFKITQLRSLKSLSMRSINLSKEIIDQLKAFKNLASLDLSKTNLPKDWLENIFSSLPNLKKFSYEETKISKNDIINTRKKLSITLDSSKYSLDSGQLILFDVDDDDLLLLESLPDLDSIKDISLQYNDKISDEGLSALKKLKNLKRINLSGCTNVTGSFLNQGPPLELLTHLNVSGCSKFYDEGLDFLESTDQIMEDLNLKNTPVTKKALQRLIRWKGSIITVNITDCKNIKANDVKLFKTEKTIFIQ